MPKTFCLLNHTLTKKQLAELSEKFNSTEIVYPGKNLAELWSHIPPVKSNEEVVEAVASWLKDKSNPGDLFIIQGEFGSTFTLVDFALKNSLVPLYATTRRIAKESRNGETVRREYIFEHVCFKRYEYFK